MSKPAPERRSGTSQVCRLEVVPERRQIDTERAYRPTTRAGKEL